MSPKSHSNVTFFPVPLPDELIDSVVYRYHHLSGNPKPRDTIHTLYRQSVAKAPKLLTTGVDTLHRQMPKSLFGTPDELMDATMFVPAFGTVFSNQQMNSIRMTTRYASNPGRNVLYYGWVQLLQPSFQCCPMCVKAELEQYGVAYWHRSHQLEGMQVCHMHGCSLISECPSCHKPVHQHHSMELPTSHCTNCQKPLLVVVDSSEGAMLMAKLGHQALTGGVPYCDHRWLGAKIGNLVGYETKEVSIGIRKSLGSAYLKRQKESGGGNFEGDWLGFGLGHPELRSVVEQGVLSLYSISETLALVHFLFGNLDAMIPTKQNAARAA